MLATAVPTPDADIAVRAPLVLVTPPSCGSCPGAGPSEVAFGCERCEEPVCGYCIDSDRAWLCPPCARRLALTA